MPCVEQKSGETDDNEVFDQRAVGTAGAVEGEAGTNETDKLELLGKKRTKLRDDTTMSSGHASREQCSF